MYLVQEAYYPANKRQATFQEGSNLGRWVKDHCLQNICDRLPQDEASAGDNRSKTTS